MKDDGTAGKGELIHCPSCNSPPLLDTFLPPTLGLLCSPGWPHPPASASPALGQQVCAASAGLLSTCYLFIYEYIVKNMYSSRPAWPQTHRFPISGLPHTPPPPARLGLKVFITIPGSTAFVFTQLSICLFI